jgi:hypothetical protein
MDRNQSLSLYREGREKWNAWAEKRLTDKAKLEESGASLAKWEETAHAEFKSRSD